MMKLTTKHLVSTEHSHTFAWKIGLRKRGIVHIVNLGFETDSRAAAEAIAIGYLLRVKQVFAREMPYGKGVELHISTRRLYEIARTRQTTFTPAHDAVSFLSTNFGCAAINTTMTNFDNMPALGDDDIIEETIDGGFPWQFDTFECPALGRVRLTRHAIERYRQYHTEGPLHHPTMSLVQRLQNPNLERQPLTKDVLRHKEKAYAEDVVAATEMWGNATSDVHFLVAREPKVATVVTLFKKANRYMSA